ncbi:MAG: helix-turn-helix domain-containing protein [Lachnospiraceae bacterium]|nr:helix-turn-helix domain-containing protein [Ruminococcus sp.]MCM1276778.1 helix-turn-helix domain-containing protein [Lachnospiraceae bacterium]
MSSKNDIQTTVGDNITECRKRLGITQDELARRLGKSVKTVQRYESGTVDLPISILAEIAAALNVSVNYLIGYTPSFIKLESLSDVTAFLLELNNKEEIRFEVELNKNAEEGKTFSLTFDAMSTSAIYNSALYDMVEKLKTNRDALEEYWINYETFKLWEEKAVLYNTTAFLTDKKHEELSDEELIKKRNEAFDRKMKEMQSQGGNKK